MADAILAEGVGNLLSPLPTTTAGIATALVGMTSLGLSQTDRPIMLILWGGIPWVHWFIPRPEDMSYRYPTRATAINTLGGAYVDDFGSAIVEINIRGNTGYATGGSIFGSSLKTNSGEVAMFSLRNMIVQNYHEQRLAYSKLGMDPDTIQLILVDALNMTSFVVYPRDFQLQRSKHSPLLYRFNMQLWGLDRLI